MIQPCKRVHYGYIILLTGIITVMGALGFARFGYATILPSMKASLGLSNSQMGQIATANLIGYMTFSLIGGILATKYGARITIAISMLFTGTTMLMTGLANNLLWVSIARFLTGLGSAGANISMMGLIAAWFAPNRRGMASGFLVGGSGIALLITGVLVPNVIDYFPDYGWRLNWLILGSAVMVIGLIGFLLLRNHPTEKNLLPIANSDSKLLSSSPNKNQLTAAKTYSWKTLYTSPILWHLGTIYFLFGFSYIVYATFFSVALVNDKNLTQTQAGLIWSLVGLLSIFSGVLWGTISDYIGRRKALAIVFSLLSICNLIFSFTSTLSMFYLSAIIFGCSAFSIPGIVSAASGDYVGPQLAPAALGMVTLFFGVGQAMAPTIAGYMADLFHSFNPAFLLAAIISALGGIGSLTLRNPQ